MSNFLLNEIPTGTINGVNTSFTTQYSMNTVTDVVLDGAPYTGSITFSGTTLTLGDAPTASLNVSYWSTGSVVPGATITVSNARQTLKNLKKDISDVSSIVFLDWCNFVNREAYELMISADPARYWTEYTINVIAGQAEYALPTGFLNMQPIGCGLFQVDANGNPTDNSIANLSPWNNYNSYTLQGSSLFLSPIPQKSYQLVLRYIPALSDLTDDSSTFCLPDGAWYQNYIRCALDVQYCQWDEDYQAEAVAGQRLRNAQNYLMNTIRRSSDSQFIPDYSTTF